jgi:hypothetical protein
LSEDAGATPFVEVLQRHYLTRQASTLDAFIEFDPRTAFNGHGPIKRQEEWLRGAFEAFSNKQSNLQLGFGVAFRYGISSAVSAPDFARSVITTWRATAPVLDLLREAESAAATPSVGRGSRGPQNDTRGPEKRRLRAAAVRVGRARANVAGPQAPSRG